MEPNRAGHRDDALILAGLAFLWPCLESFVTRCFRASLALSAFSLPTEWAGVIVCASVLACTLLTGPSMQGDASRGPAAHAAS